MFKIIATLFLVFCFVGMSSAADVIYRISSGEVVNILYGNEGGYDQDFFGTLTDPPMTDGSQFLDDQWEPRVLNYSKINDNGTIRNATQEEINTFAVLATEDVNIREAAQAATHFQNDPKFRRAVAAIIKGIIKEDNESRLWVRDFMDAVAASTSLANFQSRVAALDRPVDREFADAKTYILNQISKDD